MDGPDSELGNSGRTGVGFIQEVRTDEIDVPGPSSSLIRVGRGESSDKAAPLLFDEVLQGRPSDALRRIVDRRSARIQKQDDVVAIESLVRERAGVDSRSAP
jgi:hypothetical protein